MEYFDRIVLKLIDASHRSWCGPPATRLKSQNVVLEEYSITWDPYFHPTRQTEWLRYRTTATEGRSVILEQIRAAISCYKRVTDGRKGKSNHSTPTAIGRWHCAPVDGALDTPRKRRQRHLSSRLLKALTPHRAHDGGPTQTQSTSSNYWTRKKAGFVN